MTDIAELKYLYTINIKQTSSNEDKVIVRRNQIGDRINPEMGGSINSFGFFMSDR